MKNLILKISLIIVTSLVSTVALAQSGGIGDRAASIGGEAVNIGNLFLIAIGVAGIIFMLLGGVGLKKYADDSRSNPLMKPLIYFVGGGILAGITAFQTMFAQSLTGGGIDESTGREGFKAPNSADTTNNEGG